MSDTLDEAASAEAERSVCIWCESPRVPAPPEHIIPEALGCPATAVLRNGEVCTACNHHHGVLDQALEHSFDFVRLHVGQSGKKGQGPRITGRRNVYAEERNGECVLHVNEGPIDVQLPSGRVLKAPGKSPTDVRATFTTDGVIAQSTLRAEMLQHPKLVHALHKVAIEAHALFFGTDSVLQASFTAARDYVRLVSTTPRRVVYTLPDPWMYENTLYPMFYSDPDVNGVGIPIKLCGFEFFVDCSPTQHIVERMLTQLQEGDHRVRWSCVPPLHC